MELEGATTLPVKGRGKSKQISGIPTVSASRKLSPVRLIYAGKTEDSHPEGIKFPYAFGVTHSENHYSNETLAHQDLTGVIVLHAKQKCEELE